MNSDSFNRNPINSSENPDIQEYEKNKLLNSVEVGGLRQSNLTEPLTEKRPRFHDLYDTVSPQSQLEAVHELRETLQSTFENDLEKYQFQVLNAQKRFKDLERQKEKLGQQLNFWRSKAVQAEQARQTDAALHEQVSNDQLSIIEQSMNLQIDYLELQKQQLEKSLKQKLAETDQWRAKAAEYEERFFTSNRIQFELQSLERRIQELIDANAGKSRELETVQVSLRNIEITKSDIKKLEEDLHTVKEMLDFHVEQGRQIKAAVDALGLENAAARELLARLKDNELRLKHTLNDLAREMEHMKATKSAQFKDVVVRGEMVLNDIQTKHTLEKQNIQTQKQVLQVTLDSKLNDINHIGIINTHIDSEIKDVSQHANKLKSEADHHHIRATSAELEKRANVEREHAEKVAEINKLNRDHAFNKSVIGGHMENVNREIVHRQGDINVTSESLNRNEYERHNQVLKKSHLERSLNSYIAQYDITRKSQAIELNNRTNAQNIHLQNVDNVGKIHEHGMKETINNTTSVYEDHRRRVEDAVVRNNNFQDRLAHTINEERQLGHEANHWLRTAHEVERVKNIELSNSLERKRVQVGHLTNSIIHERNSINNANNTLVSSINHKEATNSGIRLQNVQTSNLINSTVHESQVHATNANLLRNSTGAIKNQTLQDSVVQDSITRSQVNTINHVRTNEKNLIVNDINNLRNSTNINSHNAHVLRNSINASLRAPYIRYIHH